MSEGDKEMVKLIGRDKFILGELMVLGYNMLLMTDLEPILKKNCIWHKILTAK